MLYRPALRCAASRSYPAIRLWGTGLVRMTTPRSTGRGESDAIHPELRPRIIVDGVFFQYQSSGIARVWTALLEEWAKSGFAEHVVLLDRGENEAPQISGLHRKRIGAHDYARTGADSLALEQICAGNSMPTYLSRPITRRQRTPRRSFSGTT